MGLQRAETSAKTQPVRAPSAPQAKKAVASRPAPATPSAPKKKRAAKSPQTYFELGDPREALLIVPTAYVDCTKFVESIQHIGPEQSAMFKLTLTGKILGLVGSGSMKKVVWSVPNQYPSVAQIPRNLYWKSKRLEVMATDQHFNEVTISSFGAIAEWADAKQGDTLYVTGSYKQFGPRSYFNIQARVPEKAIGSVWTQYTGVPGQVKGERIALAVAEAKLNESSWRHCAQKIIGECGLSEAEILEKIESSSKTLIELLKSIHEPKSVEEGYSALEDARRISALAIQSSALRRVARLPNPKSPILVDPDQVQKLIESQPEKLSDDQLNVITKTCQLLGNPKAMNALLSGDVGTGKTLAYLIPAVAAHMNGAQVAVIAPTTLLADQLAQQLIGRFNNIIKGVQRVESGDVIKDPSYILIGTSGLVNAAAKAKYAPNLLICDEQHKMGTATREGMIKDWTHVMDVSATPIPRSLATALYGGMEILNLRKCPVKKDIRSYVVDMGQKKEILTAIHEAVQKGERCAIVYPLVSVDEQDEVIDPDESVENAVHTVESAYKSFDGLFPGKVVMLHGKMTQDELRDGIAKMRSGERNIMIASTVIETGIDIPSVSMMVVRNADRFGISQLHQLRGRLVRNGGTGNFLMAVERFSDFPDADEEGTANETLQRLDAVAETIDGYELAERDLLLRGFGDFTGMDQTGAAKTIFRMSKLKVEDFMARKLKTLMVEPTAPHPSKQRAEKTASMTRAQGGLF